LWTVSYPDKYVEINMKRELGSLEMYKSLIDASYKEGTFNDEEYEKQTYDYESSKSLILSKWEMTKSEGLGVTYFFKVLIYVLFIISIYCAILAFFVRKKEQFIKIN
jgi:hypothetical protein